MPADWYLLDTNVLLRLGIERHTDHFQVQRAVHILKQRGQPMAYTLQNLTEFWNVATRPSNRNGFGLSVAETDRVVQIFSASFNFLPDTEAVCREWLRLVVVHEVKGVQVHDARLVATCRVYGILHLLTLNGADFLRYPGLVVTTPQSVSA